MIGANANQDLLVGIWYSMYFTGGRDELAHWLGTTAFLCTVFCFFGNNNDLNDLRHHFARLDNHNQFGRVLSIIISTMFVSSLLSSTQSGFSLRWSIFPVSPENILLKRRSQSHQHSIHGDSSNSQRYTTPTITIDRSYLNVSEHIGTIIGVTQFLRNPSGGHALWVLPWWAPFEPLGQGGGPAGTTANGGAPLGPLGWNVGENIVESWLQ